MGYYTDYFIKVDNGAEITEEIHNAIINISEYEFDLSNNQELFTYAKWYDCEDNMKQLSQLFPDKLFTIDGNGEDPEDVWRCYWKNGKIQESKRTVIYEPFDEDKLKEWN